MYINQAVRLLHEIELQAVQHYVYSLDLLCMTFCCTNLFFALRFFAQLENSFSVLFAFQHFEFQHR